MTTLDHDDDEMWIYKKHTRAKHEVMQYYATMWTKIVSGDYRTLRFFDCFAGRGDYVDSEGAEPIELDEIDSDAQYPGSPQVILDVASRHSHLFDKAECYFFEPNDTNRGHLEENLEGLSGVADNVEPHVVDREFADGIKETLRQSGSYGDFGLFFMDPFGLTDIPYDTVADITSTDKFDCIITLMTNELIRWRDSDNHEEMHEVVYGTSDWKDDLLEMELDDPVITEAEYYSQRLEAAGTEHAIAYMLREGDTRRLKYHLMFTSNDDRGFEAARDAIMYCGTPYTLAYAPEHPDFHEDEQAQLGDTGLLTESQKAKAYLLTKFAGQSIEFGELVSQCYMDRPRAQSLRKDYRSYIKNMHEDGEIEIPDRGGEGDPLPDHYVIEFPNEE